MRCHRTTGSQRLQAPADPCPVLKKGDTRCAEDVQPGNYEVNVVIGEIVINRVILFRLALSLKKVFQATVPVTASAQPLNSLFDAGGIPLKPV
jgi:hypothetical protein